MSFCSLSSCILGLSLERARRAKRAACTRGRGRATYAHASMFSCNVACTLRGKSRPGGRMLVAGIEEHQKQQEERVTAEGNCEKCSGRVSPPHLPSTFDIYRLTFNVKRASAGSKKPFLLSSAVSSFTSHSEYLPVHKLNRASHLGRSRGTDTQFSHIQSCCVSK